MPPTSTQSASKPLVGVIQAMICHFNLMVVERAGEGLHVFSACLCTARESKRDGRGSLLLLPSYAEEGRVFSSLCIQCNRGGKVLTYQAIFIPSPDLNKVRHRGPESYSDSCTFHSQSWQSILLPQLLSPTTALF